VKISSRFLTLPILIFTLLLPAGGSRPLERLDARQEYRNGNDYLDAQDKAEDDPIDVGHPYASRHRRPHFRKVRHLWERSGKIILRLDAHNKFCIDIKQGAVLHHDLFEAT
jgi:hypothetical protein